MAQNDPKFDLSNLFPPGKMAEKGYKWVCGKFLGIDLSFECMNFENFDFSLMYGGRKSQKSRFLPFFAIFQISDPSKVGKKSKLSKFIHSNERST